MSDEVHYDEVMGVIHVKVPAESTYDDMIRFRDEVLSLIERYGSDRILVDDRDHQNLLSMIEVWNVGSNVWDAFGPTTKMAVVHSNINEEQVSFFTTITRNRGFNFDHFSSYEHALRWLES